MAEIVAVATVLLHRREDVVTCHEYVATVMERLGRQMNVILGSLSHTVAAHLQKRHRLALRQTKIIEDFRN